MLPDLINGLFELVGGCALLTNCWRLYRDRTVSGVNPFVTVFFTLWGFYNLFFYPHLGLWFSFAGGCLIVFANTLWLAMAWYFMRGNK